MTADQIKQALYAHFSGPTLALFPELRTGVGNHEDAGRFIDLWVMDVRPSRRLIRTAVEIKVSRSDFSNEMRHPGKRRMALRHSNEFWFAAPKGLILPTELPPEAGLLEVGDDGRVLKTVPAPFRETLPPTWLFMASVVRRASRVERDAVERRWQAVRGVLRVLEKARDVKGAGWPRPSTITMSREEYEAVFYALQRQFDEEVEP